MSGCAHRDEVASYLLGAMPEDEHERFAAHLPGCEECRRDITGLQVVADNLPLAAPQAAPPPELKDRIMAVVRSEAELLAATGAQADEARPRPRERRGWWRKPLLSVRPLAAAAAAVVLVAVGVAGGLALSGGGESTSTVAAQVQGVPPGAQANLVVSGSTGTLQVRGMPQPPAGKVYEIWLKRPTGPPAPTAALFSVDRNGRADVGVPGSLDGVDQVLVTAEPDGGSQAPTSNPVIVASTA
jgi:anti-sigma-K factor RskA